MRMRLADVLDGVGADQDDLDIALVANLSLQPGIRVGRGGLISAEGLDGNGPVRETVRQKEVAGGFRH